MAPDPVAAARLGIRIVWQDPALADNLDIAANVMLGNERRRHLLSRCGCTGTRPRCSSG